MDVGLSHFNESSLSPKKKKTEREREREQNQHLERHRKMYRYFKVSGVLDHW